MCLYWLYLYTHVTECAWHTENKGDLLTYLLSLHVLWWMRNPLFSIHYLLLDVRVNYLLQIRIFSLIDKHAHCFHMLLCWPVVPFIFGHLLEMVYLAHFMVQVPFLPPNLGVRALKGTSEHWAQPGKIISCPHLYLIHQLTFRKWISCFAGQHLNSSLHG